MEPQRTLPAQFEVVDPEVRAYVYSLITALGGTGSDDSGRYVLGDDALACLRDLKRWLRFYDEKANRMDVARCMAEANLVKNDLLPILALLSDIAQNDKHRSRIKLACLELLVPLTWPVDNHLEMTVNHHRHTPFLRHAQVLYKRAIIGNDSTPVLRAIIRIALPSMTVPSADRTTRDEGILKLMLYLFRNMAMIGIPPYAALDGDEDDASKSATINAFHNQDVFALILTICSNMGDGFSFQDVVVLEILFHLVKGVDARNLFMTNFQRSNKKTVELEELLQRESSTTREYAKSAPTRHGRFGTMIWVKREDEKFSTVTGQDVLKDERATLLKMDKTKRWNKPKHGCKKVADPSLNNDFNSPTILSVSGRKHLRTFVEEFLDSGFNPLFTHVRKAIEREADRVTETTSRQFFFVISWFLEAERVRRDCQRKAHECERRSGNAFQEIIPESFVLVASVLNQETFIMLNRFMQTGLDYKEWQGLNAGMRCFTQILLTVQEMAQSPLEEDQEIAENIQSRIFYEESTHDRILALLRGYKDQGFWYLDACTELAHVFLRMLEQYSKQNSDMQIRSRMRARRKKAANKPQPPVGNDEDNIRDDQEVENGSEDEDEDDAAEISRTTVERTFHFQRFSAKFCTQKSVNTFIAFTTFYRELDAEQLKRAHRFFFRVAFKQELSVLLFRLDIVSLFCKMIKGPEGLDPKKPMFKEWEELVRQIIRKLVRKIDQRPELLVELLFSKVPLTLYYLEYGHDKQALSEPRAPLEVEVIPSAGSTLDGKLRIVVSALILEGQKHLIRWVCQSLSSAFDERKSWELEGEARRGAAEEQQDTPSSQPPSICIQPESDEYRSAMLNNARLRLLLTLAGFERQDGIDPPGTSWVLPLSLPTAILDENRKMIEHHCNTPAEEIDGLHPHELLRRKQTAEQSVPTYAAGSGVDFGNDSEGDEDADLDGSLFPPNIRSRSAALMDLKRSRRRHRGPAASNNDGSEGDDNTFDEEMLEEQRLAHQQRALERQRKIKSDLYIHASDEETDEEADQEFFAREEERRQAQARRVREALAEAPLGTGSRSGKEKVSSIGRKRKVNVTADGSNRKRQRSRTPISTDGGDDLMVATPSYSSPSLLEVGSSSQRVLFQETSPTSPDGADDMSHTSAKKYTPRSLDRTTRSADTTLELFERERNGIMGNNQTLNEYDSEDNNVEPAVMPHRRTRRMAGFIVDSDTE